MGVKLKAPAFTSIEAANAGPGRDITHKRKIIYVAFVPLTERIEREWYIEFLLSEGHAVEYWNLSPALDGLVGGAGVKSADYVRFFHSLAAFDAALSLPENHGAVCVMLMGYGERFVPVYRIVSKYDCQMVYVAWGYQPEGAAKIWKGRVAILANPLKLMQRLFFKARAVAFKRLGWVKPYEAVFSPAPRIVAAKFDTKKIVAVNSSDYDLFTEAAPLPEAELVPGYAVFLDNFMPYQSDLAFLDRGKVEAGQYFRTMNRLFDLVEKKYGVPVVIDGHPKANYRTEQFGGRKLFYGKTAALVKYCDFVVSHHSSSVSFAVLGRKSVIFAYTQEMKDLYWYDQVTTIRETADYLGMSIYNADKIHTEADVDRAPVDEARYQRYQDEYLAVSGPQRISTRDIFYSEMTSLLGQP